MTTSRLHTFLHPKSIAVVGASRSKIKVGHQILSNLLKGGFEGKIYPINPNATNILGLPCYPTVHDCPVTPELAVIVTPAQLVIPVVQDCLAAKVKAAIIITAGFAESSAPGEILQSQLQSISRGKIDILGPNCLGVISPVNQLNASFGPQVTEPGDIMLISQSGAMVTGVIDWSKNTGVSISHAITFGNRVDVSENDALQFAMDDPHTKTILVYLESFHNATEFFHHASAISPKKPIILLKGGSSKSGQIASASHTAALATDQSLVDHFCRQTGVINAPDMYSWLHLAELFAKISPPLGPELAIITNAGGPGVVSSDAAEKSGLIITPFSKASKDQLQKNFHHLGINNPFDLRGDAPPEAFHHAISALKTDSIQDSLLIIITPQTTTKPTLAAQAIIQASQNSHKPILVVLIGGAELNAAHKLLNANHIPTYDFPNQAISLLATMVRYFAYRSAIPAFPAKSMPTPSALQLDNKTINLKKAFRILKQANFNVPAYSIINSLNHVPQALKITGKPAIAKTASLKIAHKVLAGGVIRHLMTSTEARLAYRRLSQIEPKVLFQKTIHSDMEIILGAIRDSQFGPCITVGLGGSFTDTFNDRGYVFLPAKKIAFYQALQSTKLYQLLAPDPHQVELVIAAMQSAALLLLSHPEIKEFEINPLMLTQKKAYAVDIKITLFDLDSNQAKRIG